MEGRETPNKEAGYSLLVIKSLLRETYILGMSWVIMRPNGSLHCSVGAQEFYRVKEGGHGIVCKCYQVWKLLNMLKQVRTATFSRTQHIAGDKWRC